MRRVTFERVFLGLVAAVLSFSCRGEAPTHRAEDFVTVLLPREPQQLDPRHVGDAYGLKLSRLIHASLFTLDPYTLEVVPQLAESVRVVDQVRYEVALKPDLRFSDGSALTSADVVATFRALMDPQVAPRFARTYGRIEKVEARGERGVVFELEAPHATFLTDLEIPVLRASQARSEAGGPGGAGLVGAGPYLLTDHGAGRWDFVANPHYVGGTARHPRVRMLLVRDDNTRALRMSAGAADLALNALPALLFEPFQSRPGYEVQSAPGVGTTYLGVNLDAPELSDVRVRRAIAHAIDRKTLIAMKLGGRAALASSFIPVGHWSEADMKGYDYDPGRARRLLEQAGLTADGDGVRLRLTLRTGADRGVQSMARAIAAMLSRVGVQIELRPSETATLLADLGRGRFQLAYMQIPEVFEPHVLSWFFASNRIPIPGVQEGSNRWRLRDPEVDAALERGRASVDLTERKRAYAIVQRRLSEALPVIPLWHEDVVAVSGPGLHDFRVPRDGRFGALAR